MKNRRGMSLIEVMIAVGVSSIVAMVIMTLIQNLQVSTTTVARTLEFNTVVQEVEFYLSKPETCASLFAGVQIVPFAASPLALPYVMASTEVTRIVNLNYKGTPILAINVPRNGLQATKIEFDRVIDDTLPPVGINRRFILNFVLSVDKLGETYGGKLREKSFAVMTELNATNNIVACSAASDSMRTMCSALGGNFVASDNPPCHLVPKYE